MNKTTYGVELIAFNLGAKDAGAFEYDLGLFIDRGYLRLADLEDCQCMDHEERVKINFCPFCGEELNDRADKFAKDDNLPITMELYKTVAKIKRLIGG
jgi:hypothetical protein